MRAGASKFGNGGEIFLAGGRGLQKGGNVLLQTGGALAKSGNFSLSTAGLKHGETTDGTLGPQTGSICVNTGQAFCGKSGDISLATGHAPCGAAGAIELKVGLGASGGGDVNISAGSNGDYAAVGGSIQFSAGDGSVGGSVIMRGGIGTARRGGGFLLESGAGKQTSGNISLWTSSIFQRPNKKPSLDSHNLR